MPGGPSADDGDEEKDSGPDDDEAEPHHKEEVPGVRQGEEPFGRGQVRIASVKISIDAEASGLTPCPQHGDDSTSAAGFHFFNRTWER
jgi:hypothetical protein